MKAIVTAALLAALASASAYAQNAATGSTEKGVFTLEQAKAGERAYQGSCAACHGLNLRKTDPEAPDLTDSPFRFGWQDKTMGERFEKIRSTMPKGNPRSLDDQAYLDIVAYLLQFNGVPAGAEKLLPDAAALSKIQIVVPAPAPGASGRRR
jgi:mono/diheme cytochrome c family protein